MKSIPHGLQRQLYLYCDLRSMALAWAASAGDFRLLTGLDDSTPVRVAHPDIDCPPQYRKTGHLAFDPIIRL